ncbi:MAG TPA: ABC transporter permease subunit [Myxococcales bacterium]|nr:ABC transporter permease subunit [Myxococcales bacterium]
MIALALLLAVPGLARVQAQGELRWAGDLQGGEPYVFRDPVDPSRLTGFEVDIARELAAKLGVRERFIQNDWQNLVPSLERGDFDIILNGLEDTPALRGRILLSRPYFRFSEQLVVRRGFALRSLDQLKGHRVGTLASSLAHLLLRRQPGVQVVLYTGQEEPYQDLQNGRTDAVLLDSVIAARYGLTKPDLELADADVARGAYVVGLRKGDDDLLAAVNTALGQIDLEGIYQKWSLPPQPREVQEVPAQQTRFDFAQVTLFLQGAWMTLVVSLLAMALAVPLGLLLALARMYGGPAPRLLAHAYVEIFRGTPVLLQLYILYYGLAPVVHLNALSAAIIGLGLNYGAYEAEVHRAAMQAIPVGQSEAAAALGLSRIQSLRLVLLPQALRTALPAMTNDLIALLKDSSLVSVITVVELTKQMTITAVDVRSWALPGLLCGALYFAMSYPLARLAARLEAALEGEAEEVALA